MRVPLARIEHTLTELLRTTKLEFISESIDAPRSIPALNWILANLVAECWGTHWGGQVERHDCSIREVCLIFVS